MVEENDIDKGKTFTENQDSKHHLLELLSWLFRDCCLDYIFFRNEKKIQDKKLKLQHLFKIEFCDHKISTQ